MFRTNLLRTIGVVAIVAAIASGSALATEAGGITIGPSTVPVNPNGYRFAIDVTCADAVPCKGLLSIQTVPIKPYTFLARKAWNVGAPAFSVPAGATAPVRHRLLAGALVQLKLTGRVQVVAKIVRDGVVVGSRLLTLKLRRDW